MMLFCKVKQAFWGYECPIRKKYDVAMRLAILRNIHHIRTITVTRKVIRIGVVCYGTKNIVITKSESKTLKLDLKLTIENVGIRNGKNKFNLSNKPNN